MADCRLCGVQLCYGSLSEHGQGACVPTEVAGRVSSCVCRNHKHVGDARCEAGLNDRGDPDGLLVARCGCPTPPKAKP